MPEWVADLPEWVKNIWLIYVTCHDFLQWSIMIVLAHTAWGQQKKKKDLEKILQHIHDELHTHIAEDSSFHEDLGQSGMTEGT